MKINISTADLIVEIYRNIQFVKKLLDSFSFDEPHIIVQSVKNLDQLMNQALMCNSELMIIKKISSLYIYISEIKEINNNLKYPVLQEKLDDFLSLLMNDLSKLKQELTLLEFNNHVG